MTAASGQPVVVVGGGIAGCAAALAAATAGAAVTLFEQRPVAATPLHETGLLAEMVGSGDLGAEGTDRATGLLKAELEALGCPLLECARQARLGEHSLICDGRRFAELVGELTEDHRAIDVRREGVEAIAPGTITIVATGPVTWSPLARDLHRLAGAPFCFAFRGRPPVISAAGLATEGAVEAPPYPGADECLFVPLSEQEEARLIERLTGGEAIRPPGLDEAGLADETPLVEELAAADLGRLRGRVLSGPRGHKFGAHAALRLVAEDAEGTRYQLADLMTALAPEAQRQALDAVAALAGAELIRPGVVHRLPYLAAGDALSPTLQLMRSPRTLVAGTLAGALGYVEALATGVVAGLSAAALASGREPEPLPTDTLAGSLCAVIADPPAGHSGLVQANFGLVPDGAESGDNSKQARRERQIERAMQA
ncbi:MAG TPA: FAD-dependent oxidoreductase, partial [Armatimonadota bacterium]|nr:FAD-dependent oxidoreductase [Armatimonadota bacterium]